MLSALIVIFIALILVGGWITQLTHAPTPNQRRTASYQQTSRKAQRSESKQIQPAKTSGSSAGKQTAASKTIPAQQQTLARRPAVKDVTSFSQNDEKIMRLASQNPLSQLQKEALKQRKKLRPPHRPLK